MGGEQGSQDCIPQAGLAKFCLPSWQQGKALRVLLPSSKLEGHRSTAWGSTEVLDSQMCDWNQVPKPCSQILQAGIFKGSGKTGRAVPSSGFWAYLYQHDGCGVLLSPPVNGKNALVSHVYNLHCAPLASKDGRAVFPEVSKPFCAGTWSGSHP